MFYKCKEHKAYIEQQISIFYKMFYRPRWFINLYNMFVNQLSKYTHTNHQSALKSIKCPITAVPSNPCLY